MSEENHHHHHHFPGHHHNEEDRLSISNNYSSSDFVDNSCYSENKGYNDALDYEKERKAYKHKEQLGEAEALAAGAFALYEKHEAKKDSEHAHRHKVEEETAATIAIASGGYIFHEHHEKKEVKEYEEEGEGKKKHHFF